MNNTKCEKCGHDKKDHCKFVINPNFNYGSDKELNSGVCKITNCDCKLFKEKNKSQV